MVDYGGMNGIVWLSELQTCNPMVAGLNPLAARLVLSFTKIINPIYSRGADPMK